MKTYSHSSHPAPKWSFPVLSALWLCFIVLGGEVVAQSSTPNPKQVKAVESCIHSFAQAADERDIAALKDILHPEYRTVLNKAFGSEDLSVMTKSDYIGMAEAGKIGGSPRTVEIVSLDLEAEIAHAKVILQSETLHFTSYFSMVRNAAGDWQMLADLPHVKKL
ncbi:MAG: nuclear transport factor 2 family protein [Bacteroidota bacterium]